MSAVESLDPDSSFREWIASDLRFYREKHELSLSQLGQIMGCTRQTVSNLEHARPTFKVNDHQAKALDDHWQLNGHFRRLLRYARSAHNPDWFQEYVSYETRASVHRTYELSLVPGLFQTPAYARALLEAGQVVEDVEAALDVRMARQQILDAKPRPLLWVLLAENVLDVPVGGPEVMKAQLARLLELSELPNVTVRIVPRSAGAHPGLDGCFKILTVKEGDIAYVDAPEGGRLILGAVEARGFGVRFDRIGAVALPVASSRSLITHAMENLK